MSKHSRFVAVLLAALGLSFATLAWSDPPQKEKPKAEDRDQKQSMDNMQVLAIAIHTYADNHGGVLLQAAITDKKNKPLLSWRVALLPYLEQEKLYKEFKLDEPWDSPNNKKLLARMPKVFEDPRFQPAGKAEGRTYYQCFTGPGTVLGGPRALTLGVITAADGTANTLLVVEAGDPVPWTKPDDLAYAKGKPLPKLGGPKRGDFLAVYVDGHVSKVPAQTAEKTLRALITYDDGMAVTSP